MTLTAEFYEAINSVDNFGKLPDDDPLVIRVRELAKVSETKYNGNTRKKVVKKKHTADNVFTETTEYNLTPNRYLYLTQHGVEKKDIAKKIFCRMELLNKWVKENGLLKKNQEHYNLFNKEKCLGEYDSLIEISIDLEITSTHASKMLREGKTMKDGSRIELVHNFVPTLNDLKGHSKKETFKYWDDNRLQKPLGVMV